MNLIESVYDISKSFMEDPSHVFMNEEEIEAVANEMKETGKADFSPPPTDNNFKGVLLELVAASINYCYWYGRPDVRPNGSSSTTMYQAVEDAFSNYNEKQPGIWGDVIFEECINHLIELLSLRRFPLLEERKRHLRQLVKHGQEFANLVNGRHETILPHMELLVSTFPGFASDIFLKRASLFFIQLFRRYGWFATDLNTLHVPADYQVPKMLNHFNCIEYDEDLESAIQGHIMIPRHSQAECEIRAATVLTVKMLCELTGWNVAEVDAFFFTRRHDAQEPFHLTITTDY